VKANIPDATGFARPHCFQLADPLDISHSNNGAGFD
jgi:hypothetical protein